MFVAAAEETSANGGLVQVTEAMRTAVCLTQVIT